MATGDGLDRLRTEQENLWEAFRPPPTRCLSGRDVGNAPPQPSADQFENKLPLRALLKASTWLNKKRQTTKRPPGVAPTSKRGWKTKPEQRRLGRPGNYRRVRFPIAGRVPPPADGDKSARIISLDLNPAARRRDQRRAK